MNRASYDALQRRWNEEHVEVGRFLWQTGDPVIRPLEDGLLAALAIGPRDRVLEVGSGEGQNILNLQREHPLARFTGVDISGSRARFARAGTGASFVQADGRRLPFADGAFSLVFCRDVLHHVGQSREALLAEMLRVCALGGRVVLLESNGRNPLNLVFSLVSRKEALLRTVTPSYVRGLLERADVAFRLEHAEPDNVLRLLFHHQNPLTPRLTGRLTGAARAISWLAAGLAPKPFWAYLVVQIAR